VQPHTELSSEYIRIDGSSVRSERTDWSVFCLWADTIVLLDHAHLYQRATQKKETMNKMKEISWVTLFILYWRLRGGAVMGGGMIHDGVTRNKIKPT
jgi:hypothetical protein